MTFGLDKLIELIEERFGHRPTTLLLFLIYLGVASFMAKLIWENFVWPLTMAIRGITELTSINWRDVAEIVASLFTAAALLSGSAWIAHVAFRWWLTVRWMPKARKERERGVRLMEELEQVKDKILTEAVAVISDAKKYCDSCSYIMELNEHIEAEHKSEAKEHEHQEELESFTAGLEETSQQLGRTLSSLRDDTQ